jgi:hypothetical protein
VGADRASYYCKEGARLSPEHLNLIVRSAIAPEVARLRGYRTITTKAELRRYGFGKNQQITPTLLIPLYDVTGKFAGYHQHRPDSPRVKDGKPIKYETLAKMRMVLDIHPFLSRKRVKSTPDEAGLDVMEPPLIADPSIPLLITEGVRKADAAVSIGLCCVALLGVWNWRGTNEAGGRVALADWESVALHGRSVIIGFDSDVAQKPPVYAALLRFKAFLESRGAVVGLIYLCAGAHGEKVGLDDYIAKEKAAGHTDAQIRDGLLAMTTTELREPPEPLKQTTDRRLVEAAIREAEAAVRAMVRAQYVDDAGWLVHAVPLKDKLALAASDGSIEVISKPDASTLPTRSTFSPTALMRYHNGETMVLADLLDRLVVFIGERVVFKHNWQPTLIALWIFGTYAHATFAYYGYLHPTSPTKRCGKSLLLELLELLSFNATGASADPTAAVIFRECNRNGSTQIFDEMEKLQADKEKWGAVIAILNVGFKRGATVPRVLDPKTDTTRDFHVYSPKALASISRLPETTADRTIPIELERKKRSENTKRVGTKESRLQAVQLRDDCHIAALRKASSLMEFYERIEELGVPNELDDRARDILEPLFAIAAVADAESSRKSFYAVMLAAARAFAGSRSDSDGSESSLVAAATALRGYARGWDAFAITSKQANALFKQTDDLGWMESEAQARAHLRKMGFVSAPHRIELFVVKPADAKGEVARGYRIDQNCLDEILARYDTVGTPPGDGVSGQDGSPPE